MINITYGTTGATGATFAGLPAGVTGNWAADIVTISGTPTATGTFNYTITLTGGCGIVTANGTITINPDNTILLTSAAGTDAQTVCINTAITDINYGTTGATGATFTGLPAGVTGIWAADIVTISGIPTTSGTFNYTVTLTGGCGVATANGSIDVTPDNTINLASAAGTDAQTVCINTAITDISYITTGATGATFAGLPAGVTGSWAANVVTITGTPTVSGLYNYTVSLTGGCGIVTANGSIDVTPDNTIILSSAAGTDAQTVCINTAITDITYGTTGATGATFAGLPAGVTGNWAADVVTISGTPTTSGSYNYTVTLTGGCGVVTANGSIDVTPDNTISLTSAVGTDAQAVCINTAITDITYATTGATGATFAGLPAGVTGSWAMDVVTISGTPMVSGIFNYTVTLTGGCGIVTANGLIDITPDNTINLTSAAGTDAQAICINTAIVDITYGTNGATGATFSGLPAGITGSWAADVVTISGTPSSSGTFNYTITLTGGCGLITANGSIDVIPDNTITLLSAPATTNQSVCLNSAISDISYLTTGATGATFADLPAGVAGNWAADIITISGTPTESGTFNYTVTLTGGCGIVTTNGTITVNPDNTILLTSAAGTDAQTVCINIAITDITYGTTGATGATFSGLPAGVSGSWAADVVTISGTPTVSGTFNYTVILTGGCGIVTVNGNIDVTPDDTIILTSAAGSDNQTICNNTAISDITYSTTGATGATIAGLPAGVTGNWAADVVTISGIPTESGIFNYLVTLTGGCGNVTAAGTITSSPDNTITLSSAPGTDNQTVCINMPIVDITYSTTGATGATFTGLPTGMSVNFAANTVTITGSPTTSGIYPYTVDLTGGCGNVSANGTITVMPVNTVSLTSAAGTDAQTVCVNTAITEITYGTTGATGATFAGLPAGITGSWAADIVTISGTPTASGTFNYTVILTGGCGAVIANGSIDVITGNTISLTSAAGTDGQTVCLNTVITDITYSTTGATGATFAGLPAGVTGSWAADVVTISGTPSESGTFNYTVTLTGGCGIVTTNGSIDVTPDNTIILTSVAGTDAQTICINTAIVDVTYSTTGATGSTFSGLPAGVTGNWAADVVTISGTPTASGTFNYTVTLTGGCGVVTANGSIDVTPDNTVNLTSAAGTDAQTVCINTVITDITYSTTGATGATFTGLPDGVTGNWAADVVTISGTPTTSGIFNYTVTLTGGCGNVTANGSIDVTPDNTIILTSAAGTDVQAACINTVITDITYGTTGATGATFTGLPAGVIGSWAADVVTISGTPTESGTFNFTVDLLGGCGSVSANGSITVNTPQPVDVVIAADANPVCDGTAVTLTATPANGGANPVYQWQVNGLNAGTNSDVFSYTPVDNDAVTVILTSDDACVTGNPATSSPVIIIVNSVPAGTTAVTDVLCFGQATGAVDLTVSGGTAPYTFLWDNGETTEDLADVAAGTYNVIITDANMCTGMASGTVSQPATALSGSIISQTDVTVNGGNDGSVTVDGSGGTPPYQYSIDGVNYQPSGTFGTLTAGSYTVTVQDAALCTYDIPVTINQPLLPLSGSIVSQTDVSCFGESTGSVTITGSEGLQPYEYTIDGVNYQSSGTFASLAAGSYTVTVRDALANTFDVPVSITEPPTAVSGSVSVTDIICNGESSGAADLTAAGGTGPYTYLWSSGEITEDIGGVLAGSYSVTITDANGCTEEVPVLIDEPAPLQIEASVVDASCPGVRDGSISLTVTGGTQPYMILWNDGLTTLTRNARDSVYRVIVTDANLCVESLDIEVTYSQGSGCIEIPMVITPNGDGKNDTWIIRNIEMYPNAELLIFNRWGRKIYQTKNISANPWDGKYRGKFVATDSYHYILYVNDGTDPRTGTISVIR